MAINKNHEFEDLGNTKCAIVEKNVSAERVAFLKNLLEFNKYQVVVVDSPAPKTVPAAVPTTTEGELNASSTETNTPVPPITYTVGVTDLTFNAINAIFGRQLKTADGHIVSLAYWQQKELISNDSLPYFENK